MEAEDLSNNSTIASLKKLTRDLEQSRSPRETLRTIRRGLGEAYGILSRLMLSTQGLPEGHFRVVQLQLEGGELLIDRFEQPPEDPIPVLTGGVIARIIANNEPQLLQDVDWSADPHFSDALSGYTSVVAVPFNGKSLPLNWAIMLRKSPARFSAEDVEQSMVRIALSGSLLESQELAEQLPRANERIDRDAKQVGELQRMLLPATLPRISGLEIAVSYEPSGRAGGDLYDVFPVDQPEDETKCDPARWCLIVGDAAGHGLAAAVVMAIVQSVLHAHPTQISGPADLMAHANRQLCRKNIGGFFTAFLAIYEPASRRFTYSGAGHPPPLLKRAATGNIGLLDAVASYPLGINSSETFEEACIFLEPGDTLLLYTDGITEARDSARDMFDADRLKRAFRDIVGPPAEMIARLRSTLVDFEQGRTPDDDQALVVVRVSSS